MAPRHGSARLVRLALSALVAAGACSAHEEVVESEAGIAPRFTRAVQSYAWGADPIPWLAPAPPERLVFGELGRTPLTGLYLTFHTGLAREAAAQPAGWTVSAEGVEPAPGRFGDGLRLGPSSRLVCSLPEDSRARRAATLEFWIRPAALEERALLAWGDWLTLRCGLAGRLWVEGREGGAPAGAAGGFRFGSAAPLVAGAWNHVGLVLDRLDLHVLRLVVNGSPAGRVLSPATARAWPRELVLGAAGADGLTATLDELRVLERALSTQALARHARAEPRALERLRVVYGAPEAEGVEELDCWRAPLVEPRVDTPDEWARGEREHVALAPDGLAWSAEDWQRVESADAPAPRTTHALASLGGGRLFLFGGETRDSDLAPMRNTADTWLFDGASWKRSASGPSPRCHVPAAYSPEHDLVLLYGGWHNGIPEDEFFTDTWLFHVAEERWEERHPAGTRPSVSNDFGLVYLPELRRFLCLSRGQAWLYDPRGDRWERRPPSEVRDAEGRAAAPPPASAACALEPSSGQVLVFGGLEGADGFSDQTSLYDPAANRVTRLALEPRPPARVRPALAFDPVRERFVLFGGVRDQFSQRFDDLWTFDPRARCWSEVARGAERPSARGGYFGMAYDERADRFLVPDGRHAPDRWLDEALALELDERAPGRARYLFDRAGFAERAWFVEAECPPEAAVTARFRGGDDGLRFGAWSASCPPAARFVEVELALQPAAGRGPRVRAMGFR